MAKTIDTRSFSLIAEKIAAEKTSQFRSFHHGKESLGAAAAGYHQGFGDALKWAVDHKYISIPWDFRG